MLRGERWSGLWFLGSIYIPYDIGSDRLIPETYIGMHWFTHRFVQAGRSLIIAIGLLWGAFALPVSAQQVLGTSGLMCIPTADMLPAGTFLGGASLTQRELLADAYTYNNGLYYVTFAPFSFIELTFRETLQRGDDGSKKLCQQDRSTSIRLRPLHEVEGKWWPSLAIGVNDIYSDMGRSWYAAWYGVLTKHLALGNLLDVGVSVGGAIPIDQGESYDGVFAGVSLSPQAFRPLNVMVEYDTRGVNIGASVQLFKHLNLLCFTREFTGICAGISYQHTIKF